MTPEQTHLRQSAKIAKHSLLTEVAIQEEVIDCPVDCFVTPSETQPVAASTTAATEAAKAATEATEATAEATEVAKPELITTSGTTLATTCTL